MAYDGPYDLLPGVTKALARAPALFIDGAFQPSQGKATLPVFDPSTGLEIALAADATPADVDLAAQSAAQAFHDGRWRHMRPADRERVLLRFADLVAADGETFAQLETLEQGKSIHLSRAIEVEGSVEWMRYVAGLTTKIHGRSFDVSLPGGPQAWTAYSRREPIGVVAGISPWNFPMLIALWKVMPALAAGCSIVLKPSEVAPLTALRLAETAVEAGLPPGVFNIVTGAGRGAGQALVEHSQVRKISFTGSTATGIAIGRSAMADVKRVTLELGGKNPAIVLKDADLAAVVAGLMVGGFVNGGQVCAAAARVYVEAEIFDDVVGAMSGALGSLSIGAGLDPQAQINPLASAAHRDKVVSYLAEAKTRGADVVGGGQLPESGGYFVRPSLVLNPSDELRLTREEVFGPVLNLVKVASAEEALALANDSSMGLAASVWTKDISRAMDMTARLEAGTVWVNSHVLIDPNMPFGGLKRSGIGRDFGVDWLDAYTELKSVCIHH